MRVAFLYLALVLGWFGFPEARAQRADEARIEAAHQLISGLKFQSGVIALGDNLATLRLPDSLQYLSPADTKAILTKLWDNPETDTSTLGMIVPKGVDFLSSSAWAVVVTYEEDGHIKDNDAASIDYTKMLAEMKESVKESNPEREKAGYPTVELIGWAAPPKYDSQEKKLYWAKELRFGTEQETTLNYNIRILGRKGVLNLNAIASSEDLSTIEKATPELLSSISFNKGQQYADFDSSTDKLATYGLAALVAGGVAAKVGLFKGLWIGILAFKKLIIVGIVAVVGLVKRLFGKKAAS